MSICTLCFRQNEKCAHLQKTGFLYTLANEMTKIPLNLIFWQFLFFSVADFCLAIFQKHFLPSFHFTSRLFSPFTRLSHNAVRVAGCRRKFVVDGILVVAGSLWWTEALSSPKVCGVKGQNLQQRKVRSGCEMHGSKL